MTADIDFLVAGGALEGPLARRLMTADDGRSDALPAGTRIGAFRLVAPIGSGGSGWVYKAERADGAFDQTVALKVLRGGGASAEAIERERRILGALRHPGIAMILDGGTTAEGMPWFAMELVDGDRIDRHCQAHALDWRRRLQLLAQVAAAVAHAHRHLVVHRDIKPANVLIDAAGRPKLVDFGIAGSTAEPEELASGSYAFTPEYASPEQLSGQDVTPASDVFQLGRLLEQLLCGRDATAMPKPMPRTARRALAAIVRRACQAEPQDRYPYADAFAAEIERVLVHRPPRAQHAGPLLRSRLFLRRHAAAATVAFGALALLVGATAHWTRRVAEERDVARAEAIQARIGSDIFSYAFGGRRAIAGSEEAQALALLLDRAISRYRNSPRQQLVALAAAGRLLLDLGQPGAARDLFLRTPVVGSEWPAERAAAKIVEARAHRQGGDLPQAQAALEQAEVLLARTRPARSLQAAFDVERVDVLERLDEQERAAPIRKAALAALEHADELETDTLIRLLGWQASTVFQHGDIAEGTRLQRRITALTEVHSGADSWAAWREQRRLAWYLVEGGDLEGARAILAAQRQAISADDPAERREHAALLTAEAGLAEAEGDLERAEALSAQSYAIHREISQGGYNLAVAASNHAALLYRLERMDEAIARYEEALAVQTAMLGPDHLNNLAVRLMIADIRCGKGDYALANAGFEADLEAYRSHVNVIAAHAALAPVMWADCLLRQNRVEEARAVMTGAEPALAAHASGLDAQDRKRAASVRTRIADMPAIPAATASLKN